MDGLTITISWEYALGIFGFLIGGPSIVAWYASARFTKLETSMEWVRDTVEDIKATLDGIGMDKGNTDVQSKGVIAVGFQDRREII